MNEEKKRSMKLLNYYNEYSTYLSSMEGTNEKQLLFENLRFLGIEDINCLRFELNNGFQIKRRIDDIYVSYEALTDIEYNEDEFKKIVFKEIISENKNL